MSVVEILTYLLSEKTKRYLRKSRKQKKLYF